MHLIYIDTDREPEIPDRMRLWGSGTEHRPMGYVELEKRADGKLYANDGEINLYVFNPNDAGKSLTGHEVRRAFASYRVLNACILDALLKHQDLVPEEWKLAMVFFWGTILKGINDHLFVEALVFKDGRFVRITMPLDCKWITRFPAALLQPA